MASVPPRDLVRGQWPHGRPLAGHVEAGYAQRLAINLGAAIGERSLRDVARDAGVSHSTLLAVLNGERWASLVTIARLESALGTRLWPGE